MRIEIDILDYMTGGVLSMKCENKWWRPVVFLSKSLNKTERNYEIHDKEILTIIRVGKLEVFIGRCQAQVWGLDRSQELRIFYKGTEVGQKTRLRSDFTLKHGPGTKMGKENGLNRRPDWKVGIEKNNKNQTFIKE